MKKILSFLLLMLLPMTASADAVEIDGVWYNLIPKGEAAEVTSNPSGEKYSGDIVIPDKVTYDGVEFNVLKIADGIFADSKDLTSISFLNGITEISSKMLYGCTGLISVKIPDTVTKISDYAFYNCRSLTSVDIPNSVITIGQNVFAECQSLESIVIPNSVTSIANDAFYNCRSLTSVSIPSSITSIGSDVFLGCNSLTSVTIPNSVISIGSYAFSGCNSLASVTIPSSVTSIGSNAFAECNSLDSVFISDLSAWFGIKFSTIQSNPLYFAHHLFLNDEEVKDLVIPESVTSVANDVFRNFSGLTSVTFPNSVKSIASSAFSGCSGLTSVTIPSSVTSIGGSAFSGCKSLNSVYISDLSAWCGILFSNSESNPLYFAHHLYLNDEEVKDLIIPEDRTSVNSYAFIGCSGLTSVTIHTKVNYIRSQAFANCIELKDVYCMAKKAVQSTPSYSYNQIKADETAFQDSYPEYITLHVLPSAFNSFSEIKPWNSFKEIVIFEAEDYIVTQEIGGLWYITNLDIGTAEVIKSQSSAYFGNIVIPGNLLNGTYIVNSIGESAFEGCSELTDITIPSNVKTIKDGAFYDCKALTLLNIPDGVTSIGLGAFSRCTNLESVIIPSSVTDIESYAFDYCTSLNRIVSESQQPAPFNNTVFDSHDDKYNVYSMATLVVPNGTKSVYQSTAGWNNFSNIFNASEQNVRTIHIPKSGLLSRYISSIERENIEDLTLTGELGGFDFYIIRSMAGISYREGRNERPEDIGTNGKLKSLDISDVKIVDGGVYYATGGASWHDWHTQENKITSYLFYGTKLETIIIPNSVTGIDPFAFYRSLLTTIKVGQDNKIYDSRDNCNAIIETSTNKLIVGCKNSVIPNSVTSIGENAFKYCGGLTSITIPQNITSIGNYAFGECSGLTSIYSEIENPFAIGDDVFHDYSKDIYSIATLYVPQGTKAAYQATEGWNKFKKIVEKGDNGFEFEVDGIRYKVGENNTVAVIRKSIKYSGDVVIPSQVNYQGTIYNVTGINRDTFVNCKDMNSIAIPNSLTFIGSDAFESCIGLKAVYITDLEAWFRIVFSTDWSNPLFMAHHLYLNGEEIKDLEIPSGVVSINNYAFYKCNGLTSVTIPNSVTSIGKRVFDYCLGITSITIPNSVTSIGSAAFNHCENLSTIHIGEGVKEIGAYAFANIFNSANTRAEEGERLEVYCYAEEVPNTSDDAFDGTPTESSILHVPASAVEAYKAAWPWSDFMEIVPISNEPLADNGILFSVKDDGTLEVIGLEDGTTNVDILSTVNINGRDYEVTSIGKRAFEGKDSIEYLSIPSSVTYIGEFAFIDCGNNLTVNIADPESWCQMEIAHEHSSPLAHAKKVLVHDVETDKIEIPEGVTSIGNYTFYQCQCIKSLTIPATVKAIGSSAFEDCTALTSLSLSEGLETIGGSAFQGCTGLTTLSIPSTVKTIKINGFNNCKGITDVYCYAESVPTTDEHAFDGTPTEKSTLHVPADAIEAYKAAWPWSDFKEIVALNGDDPDGIMAVKLTDSINFFYDLNGRKTDQPRKGIYIRNGKKFVVK